MTPEGKVKKAIDELLKLYKVYKHKPVTNGLGESALDYHVCHRGLYAGIEAKKPGGDPTKRQIITMKNIARAGGAVFLIDEAGTISRDFYQLVGWLIAPTAGFLSLSAKRHITGDTSE